MKDDSVYLLNDAKHILKLIPQETSVGDDNKMDEKVNIVDKQKYEQAVSEYNILCTFIKTLVGRNITVLEEKEYNHVRTEYGEINNASDISNGDGAIADI